MASQASVKVAWTERFLPHPPTVQKLRDGYPRTLHGVFDAAIEMLRGLEGSAESVSWQGVPWRWTILIHMRGTCDAPPSRTASATRAFAYIVPDPVRLQLCLPLSREQIAAMPLQRFKRPVREGLAHARSVAGVYWPSWDLPTRAAVDDITDLVRRKHRCIAGPMSGAMATGA